MTTEPIVPLIFQIQSFVDVVIYFWYGSDYVKGRSVLFVKVFMSF